jgi:hypothetical protein
MNKPKVAGNGEMGKDTNYNYKLQETKSDRKMKKIYPHFVFMHRIDECLDGWKKEYKIIYSHSICTFSTNVQRYQ